MNNNTSERYIFLDIDGVLATVRQYNLTPFAKSYIHKYDAYPFDKKCVKKFNEILEETDAEIILSSDWQIFYKPQDMEDIFEINGVAKKPTLYAFPKSPDYDIDFPSKVIRAYSINRFLVENPKINNYVIIDDLDLRSVPKKLYKYKDKSPLNMNRFVHTSRGDWEGIKQCGIKEKILEVIS